MLIPLPPSFTFPILIHILFVRNSLSFSCYFFFARFVSTSPFCIRVLHYTRIYICRYTLWHRCIDETNSFRRKGICIIRTNTQAPSTLVSIYRASCETAAAATKNRNTFSLSSIFIRRAAQNQHTLTNTHKHTMGINKALYLTTSQCISCTFL